MTNRIPLSRGLGSSAAAVVGRAPGGAALGGLELTTDRALVLATSWRATPTTPAAALLGRVHDRGPMGDTDGDPLRRAARNLRAVLFIPDLRLSTRAHACRPSGIACRSPTPWRTSSGSHWRGGSRDGRTDLLRHLTIDRLHEPYRAAVYPQLPQLVAAAREAGALGACSSGAGKHGHRVRGFAAPDHAAGGGVPAASATWTLPGRVELVAPRNKARASSRGVARPAESPGATRSAGNGCPGSRGLPRPACWRG